VLGQRGNDTIRGDGGDDHLHGGPGDDLLFGDSGRDRLIGGDGPDSISGNRGHDVFVGGGGADILGPFGDSRADRMLYKSVTDSTPHASDKIVGFEVGLDIVDLQRIDAISSTAGDEAFHWIGGDAFHQQAGELRYDGDLLQGDVDGDGIADLQIEIRFIEGFSDADILL
jgi:serralysin